MPYIGKQPATSAQIDSSADIVDGVIQSADIQTLDAAKLTGTVVDARISALTASKLTGTIDNARIALDAAEIPNLDTAKVTTGTFANARISEASVTQHVAAADLTPAHHGIANLGLIVSTEHTKVAFNLTNSFIDTFQDTSGVTTNTTVERHSSDYYYPTESTTTSSWSTPAYLRGNRQSRITVTSNHTLTQNWGGQNAVLNMILDGAVTTSFNGSDSILVDNGAAAGKYFRFDFGTAVKITEAEWFRNATTIHGTYKWQGGSNGSTWTDIGSSFNLGGTASPPAHVLSTGISGNTTGYRWYQLLGVSGSHSQNWDQNVNFKESTYSSSTVVTTPATATLISDPQTVSSTTEVSGVFIYTDGVGTNTIGTDLKIYFTANNGTNWTEASSYGTATTFSGSIRQVTLGKTTVTAGTQVALKAVWAGQSASKIAHLNGWSVNY